MRLMKGAVAASLPLAAAIAILPGAGVSAAPSFLAAPTYSSTLVGPGLASMYPVDVTSDSQYYFALDAGRYRLLAVNRTTHNIDWQIGGLQGSGNGQFGDARAISYDATTGNVYVADTPNNRVEVFSFSATSGFAYLAQFGIKGSGNCEFTQAYGVAIDSANRWVYVTDGAGRVEKFTIASGPPTCLGPTGTGFLSTFGKGTLNQPRQVSVAPNSDVLVMNRPQNKTQSECYVFNSSGTLEFGFGSSGKGIGQFTADPRGVSVSADGTLAFATDSGGKRIEAFTLTQSGGHYTGAAFDYAIPSGSGNGAFVGPRGLTTTADNHLVLTDEWGYNLHEFSFTPGTTTYSSTWNGTPTAPPVPGVDSPRGVQVAANGDIYIMDYWNQRVEYGSLGTSGQLQGAQTFGFRGDPDVTGAINFAWSIALQPGTGDVFVANRESNQVESFTPTGTPIQIYGQKGTANSDLSFPQGIAFDPTNGTLLVVDSGNDRIQRFTLSTGDTGWKWDNTYGSKGTGSTSPAGDLNMPTGIAVDSAGTVWVADTLNNRIQSMSPSGVWAAPIHQPTGTPKAFKVPWGVTAAPDGSIWVSDTGNNRIVSMSTSGGLNFSATESTMGIPPVSGDTQIFPFAIAFSGDTVYLTDIWNNRVVVLTTH